MSNEKSFLNITKGAGIIFFGVILGNLFGLFNQILFGRILGPENYGIFNLGLSIVIILGTLVPLGLSQGLTQYIPFNIQLNNHLNVKKAVSYGFKLPFLLGLLLAFLLFLFSDNISILFHEPILSPVIKLFAISIPFWALHNIGGSLTQAFKKPTYFVLIENIGMPIIQILLFLLFLLIGFSLFGAVIGFLGSCIFSFVAYIYIYHSKFKPLLTNSCSKNFSYSSVRKELFSISFPLFLAGSTFLFIQYADRLILGFYMNPLSVGIYTAALTIASLLLFVFSAFSFNYRPILSEYFASKNLIEIKKLYSSITKWIFLITFPLTIYVIFYSKDIISLIYGENFIAAQLPLIILSIGISMNGLTGLTGETLISLKKTNLNLYSEVIGASSNLLLNLSLIPIFGIFGAALGTSISIILRNITSYIFVYHNLKFHPYNWGFIKIFLSCLISIALIFLIFSNYESNFKIIIAFPIYFTIFFFLIYILNGFEELDIILIKKIFIKIKMLFF